MKNWYKKSQTQVQQKSYKKHLQEIHPSLRKNIFFMAGIDGNKYPQGHTKMKKLQGDEWRAANKLYWLGDHWRPLETNERRYRICRKT